MSSGSKVTFRRARPEDHAGIIEMNDMIYNGLDYLHAYFPIYIRQPHRFCFVAEMDGKIMAYAQRMLVDDGKATIGQSGRRRPGYGRMGIFTGLGKYINEEMTKLNHGDVKRKYTAIYGPYQQKFTQENGVRILEKRHWRVFVVDDIRPLQAAIPVDGIRQLNLLELQAIIEDEATRRRLFPNDSFTSEWEPFSLVNGLKTNLQHIFERTIIYASFDSHNNCLAVSASGGCNCKIGYRGNIDFYGSDEAIFKAHIIVHATNALKIARALNIQLHLFVHMSQDVVLQRLNIFATELGWTVFKPFKDAEVFVAGVNEKRTSSKL